MTAYQTAKREFEEAIEELEDQGVPERAEDFVESVKAKFDAIVESVNRSDGASEGQIRAIENMAGGVRRWLRGGR